MATKDNRYSHGKIYKLIDNTTGMFYIGSTALNRLDQRFRNHVMSSKQVGKMPKLYSVFTAERLQSGDIKMILLQEVNVNSKKELEKIENNYIQRELHNILCLNTNSSQFDLEKRIKYMKEYHKNYYQQHMNEVKEKIKEYQLMNNDYLSSIRKEKIICDCGIEIVLCNMPRHKRTQKHINLINSHKN